MRHLITCIVALLFCPGLYAQGVPVELAPTDNNVISKGNHILGFHTKLSGEIGKNKFESGDNTRKPSEISYSAGVNWETLVNDHLAVGAFAEFDVDINKDKELDQKWTNSSLVVGPMATCYKPCGELDNGGLFSMVMVGAGFHTNSFTDGDDKQKDPIGAIISGQLDVGGYYSPVDDLLLTASIGMFGFQTEFMNMEDGFSSPDMVTTDFKFGIREMVPKIAVKYKF